MRGYRLQPEDDIMCALKTSPNINKVVKQLRDKILIEVCGCGR